MFLSHLIFHCLHITCPPLSIANELITDLVLHLNRISVVIQNQTNGPLEVRVGARATNATVITDTAGVKFTLAGSKRHAVTFPVITGMPGTARFQFFVSAPGFADAAELSVPVFTPSTSEAFATYGDIGPEKSVVLQPIRPPTDAYAEFGGLEVSTSSTALQVLYCSHVQKQTHQQPKQQKTAKYKLHFLILMYYFCL
jgi:hypothetical protein